METDFLEAAARAVASARLAYPAGRLSGVAGGVAQVRGLAGAARLGDRVRLGRDARGEVVGFRGGAVRVLLDGEGEGLAPGALVRLLPPPGLAPGPHWIGRVIDPDGRPLDGRPLLPGPVAGMPDAPPPPAHLRRGLGPRLTTGYAALDTLLPLARGQRIGLFAGSGVGKSTLLGGLARQVAADVTVIALVGERGRELRAFVEEVLGPQGMARSVVVAATSDRPPQERRRCAAAAMCVAEHYRDAGLQVLLLMDSVTRFAEAHREVAFARGEAASLRGFPASTGPAIASLCERAGPGAETAGDITAVFTVLVAGSDMDEPVADMLRGVLDGHVVLDREIAERGRFPAVDAVRSVSRSLPGAATAAEAALIGRARRLLGVYDRAEMMIQSGLYTPGSDPELDEAVARHADLDAFLARQDLETPERSFAELRRILSRPLPQAAEGHGTVSPAARPAAG